MSESEAGWTSAGQAGRVMDQTPATQQIEDMQAELDDQMRDALASRVDEPLFDY